MTDPEFETYMLEAGYTKKPARDLTPDEERVLYEMAMWAQKFGAHYEIDYHVPPGNGKRGISMLFRSSPDGMKEFFATVDHDLDNPQGCVRILDPDKPGTAIFASLVNWWTPWQRMDTSLRKVAYQLGWSSKTIQNRLSVTEQLDAWHESGISVPVHGGDETKKWLARVTIAERYKAKLLQDMSERC